MALDRKAYFKSVYDRRATALHLLHREVSTNDWKPATNTCHENVKFWVSRNPKLKAVRGWVQVSPEWPEKSPILFRAHSVIDDGGTLYDITSKDYEQHQLIPHLGAEQDFLAMIENHINEFRYPPCAVEEFGSAPETPLADDDEWE